MTVGGLCIEADAATFQRDGLTLRFPPPHCSFPLKISDETSGVRAQTVRRVPGKFR
jgi:hypothetical protein